MGVRARDGRSFGRVVGLLAVGGCAEEREVVAVE